MCRELQLKIYAVVALRPSSVAEVGAILRTGVHAIKAALMGMDSAGLLLYEDGEELRTLSASALIRRAIWDECSALVDAFERQIPLPDTLPKK